MQKIIKCCWIIALNLNLLFPCNFALAQCPSSSFDVQDTVCLGEDLLIKNSSINADSFSWDFCAGDFKNQSNAVLLKNISTTVNLGITIIKESDNWYGFLTSRDNNKLFKIEFGTSISNPNPSIVDIGNPDGLLQGPEDLMFVNQGGVWYGLIYNGGSGKIVRYKFSNGLNNAPVGSVAYSTGLSQNVMMDIKTYSDSTILAYSSYSNNHVYLLNFGNNLENNPNSSDLIDLGTISGANGLRGLSLINECNRWYCLAVAQGSKSLHLIDFGNGLFRNPKNIFNIGSIFGSSVPFDISAVEDAGDFLGFIVTNNGNFFRVNLGDTIQNTYKKVENLGNYGLLSTTRSLSLVKDNSQSYIFTTNSTGGKIYKIGFDDACGLAMGESKEANPQNISYTGEGYKYISLQGNDTKGNVSYYLDSVFVQNLSAPSISFATENACVKNENNFVANSTDNGSVLNWEWDFGDSATTSGQNVNHLYDSLGVFLVTLEIRTLNGCTNKISDSVAIYPNPIANFDIPSSNLCTNSEQVFINTSNVLSSDSAKFLWDFDGVDQSTTLNGIYNFNTSGTKQISLIAEVTGCIDTLTQLLNIMSGPSGSFSWTNNCRGDTVHFLSSTSTNDVSYAWNFGDSSSQSIEESPKHFYENEGSYLVKLNINDNNNGCSTKVSDSLVIYGGPLANYTYNETIENIPVLFKGIDLTLSRDSIISWNWKYDGLNFGSTKSVEHVFPLIGEHIITLNVVTAQGCVFDTTKTISVIEAICPSVDFNISDTVCLGEDLLIKNSSINADSFSWDFCAGDFKNQSNAGLLKNISTTVNLGITIVKESDNWYGFLTSRDNNRLFKIEFGTSISNPNPSIVDIGNPDGLLQGPEDLVFVNQAGIWYGLIYNGGSGKIVRYKFSNGLNNSPVGSVAYSTGLSQNVMMDVKTYSDSTILAYSSYSNNHIYLLNFGNNLENNPNSSDLIDLGAISGANGLRGLSLINECNRWYCLAVAQGSKSLHLIDFGNGLFRNPINIFNIGSIFGSSVPFDISVVEDAGDFLGFVVTDNGSFFRVDLGNTIQNTYKKVEDLGNYGLLSTTRSLSLVKDNSQSYIFTTNSTGGKIYKIGFDDACGLAIGESKETNPQNISYTGEGYKYISLQGNDTKGNVSYYLDSVVVQNLSAPAISFSTENACIGNTNQFTATSPDDGSITSYSWNFDDSITSTLQNPTHQFDTAGIYDVQLTIGATNGCSNTAIKTVPIFPPPRPDFAIDAPLPCSNTELFFTNQTEAYGADTLVSYSWNFNDEFSASAEDTTLVFPAGGTKNITLSASIPGCTSDTMKSISIIDGPAVKFDWTGKCIGELTEFNNLTTGNNITDYMWDFGDGFSSNLQQPSHLYTDGGNYDVSLLVTNAAGCQNELAKPLEIGYIPSANFDYELPCSDQDVQFFDRSTVDNANIVGYKWYHNNELLAADKDPMLSFSENGTQNVSLTVESNVGCTDSIVKPVEVLKAPDVDILADIGCASEATKFTSNSTLTGGSILSNTWMIGGNIYTGSQVNYEFKNPGDYNVTLTARGSNLCQQTLTKTFSIYPLPTADFTFTNPCDNEDIAFTSTSASEGDPISDYTWKLDNEVVSFENGFYKNIPVAGSHAMELQVSTANDCMNSVTKNFEVYKSPVAKFTAEPVTGAPPLDVTFTNKSTNATAYLWDFSENNDDTDVSKNTYYVYNDLGTESPKLIAANDNNCSDTSQVNIEIVAPVFDMAIEDVVQSVDGDQINFLLKIKNQGTVIVTNPEVAITFNNEIEVSEVVDHTFFAGGTLAYPVSFSLLNMPDKISSLCFEIKVAENTYEDISPLNNEECINFGDDFLVIDPYPNPVKDYTKVPVILPEKQNIEVRVYNGEGALVYSQSVTDTKSGLNVITLDLGNISSGNYLLSLKYSGQTKSKKLIIGR